MPTCSFCLKEYTDDHEWIKVDTITVYIKTGDRYIKHISDGEHMFCCLSCLNTFMCLVGQEHAGTCGDTSTCR